MLETGISVPVRTRVWKSPSWLQNKNSSINFSASPQGDPLSAGVAGGKKTRQFANVSGSRWLLIIAVSGYLNTASAGQAW